jgi:hypothetical protein
LTELAFLISASSFLNLSMLFWEIIADLGVPTVTVDTGLTPLFAFAAVPEEKSRAKKEQGGVSVSRF